MQCDWISAFCESRGFEKQGYRAYDTGRCLLVGPGGTVERDSSRGLLVEGSFDNRLLVQSRTGTDLYLSGNPVKFIQGHNLYGPSDPKGLFFDAGWEVRKAVGLFPGAHTWEAHEFEGPRFTRIDLTRSYRFPSAAAARTWLRECGGTARSRHGGAVNTDGTIYFGKGSTRWSEKCYHKLDELLARGKGHRLPDELPERARLLEWAEGVVRFELTLRAKELEKIEFANWSAGSALEIWQQYFDKITWNQNAAMVERDMLETQLPVRLQGVLEMWRNGLDLRDRMPKRTFYRTRRELLDGIGVDIASPPPRDAAASDVHGTALDSSRWDPEPLEGYSWDEAKRQRELA